MLSKTPGLFVNECMFMQIIKKLSIFIFTLILGVILTSGTKAYATKLEEYERSNDGKTIHRGGVKVKSIQLGSEKKRDGLSFYGGHAILELEYFPQGKPSFTKKVNVWFDKKSQAMVFVSVMNGDKNLDLYYNYSEGSFNWTASYTTCAILNSFFCRDRPIKAVNFNDLDGNKLWVHNPDTNNMVTADESAEAHDPGKLGSNVNDGARDGSEVGPSESPASGSSDDNRSISV